MLVQHHSLLTLALIAASTLSGNTALAVRVNPDGHGQALIYPYYTARSTAAGNAFVTALAATNTTAKSKALKVRVFEGKVGAEVLDFNLFLGAYDVWTAGIIGAGPGAGMFSSDHSCTAPAISADSLNPTRFRNAAYVGDSQGDGLDRTYEGYFEILEMSAIVPQSAPDLAVTPAPDYSAANASRPSCVGLPITDAVPHGLARPTGGLSGNASYININEGTDYSVDAIALSQWSAVVQWSAAGSMHPNLADANPPVSYVTSVGDNGDMSYLSRWNSGRDAVTALFMVNRVRNDFTMEPGINAATDWVLTMPTKRFHVSASSSDAPFSASSMTNATNYACELLINNRCESEAPAYLTYDREGQEQHPGRSPDFEPCIPAAMYLCGVTAAHPFLASGESVFVSKVFQSVTGATGSSWSSAWINGWFDLPIASWRNAPAMGAIESTRLIAPPSATTVINTATGQVTAGMNATYFGLPILGFAAQSYSTTGLPGVAANVLSNYGGAFSHKFFRRIEVRP